MRLTRVELSLAIIPARANELRASKGLGEQGNMIINFKGRSDISLMNLRELNSIVLLGTMEFINGEQGRKGEV